jgi:hypothetical protein
MFFHTLHIHSAKPQLLGVVHRLPSSSRLAGDKTAGLDNLDWHISSAFHIGSVQLLVKVASIAYNLSIVLCVGCGAVAKLPHNHLTTLLPALEQSPLSRMVESGHF